MLVCCSVNLKKIKPCEDTAKVERKDGKKREKRRRRAVKCGVLAAVLEPRCGYAENETDMTQSEAGKQAQPALPGVTIWPCLMAKQPAGCTHTVIHTHMLVYLVSPLCSPLFLFLSLKS